MEKLCIWGSNGGSGPEWRRGGMETADTGRNGDRPKWRQGGMENFCDINIYYLYYLLFILLGKDRSAKLQNLI